MMNPKKIFILTIIFLSVTAQASVIKVKVRNLGDWTVSFMKSTHGMITSDKICPSLDADSCFIIDSGDYDGIDVITFNCTKGKENINKTFWIPFVKSVNIDFNAENKIDSDENPVVKAASDIAEQFRSDFYDYMRGQPDRLHLHGDTIAASAYRKLTSHRDSLNTLIEKSVPENIAKVFRQDITLGTSYWFSQCAGHAKYGRQHISPQNETEWNHILEQMKKDLELNASENALSYIFKNTVYGYFADYAEKENILSGPSSKETTDRLFFKYVTDNMKGKAAETICGRIIVEDNKMEMYSKWIPELAADFYNTFPDSDLEPIIKEAVKKNLEMNSPKDMAGISFITTDSIKSVDELISLYRGKPVLIDIWATWCGPCRKSFKEHGQLRQFAAEKGVVLLYVSIDESENAIEAVMDVAGKYGLRGEHIVTKGDLRNDIFSKFGNQRGILSVPHTALFDKDGKLVVKRFQESEAPAELLKKLQTLLP